MEYCDLIVNTLDSMCRGNPGDDDDFARCDFQPRSQGFYLEGEKPWERGCAIST